MQATYPFGLKILCDGYVTGRHISNIKALIIKCFLCDGYVIGFQKGVCNGYATELGVSKLKALIINEYVCNGYVIERLKILFDGYLTGNRKTILKNTKTIE